MKNVNKERLLTWLKEQLKEQENARDRLEVDHVYWEFHEGASVHLNVVIKEIEKGSFDMKEGTE